MGWQNRAARRYVIRSCAWHSTTQSNNKRRPNRFRCQNPTTARQQLLVEKGVPDHGVHTTGQAAEA